MPRIKFLKDFEYKPIPQQTYLYKKGDVLLVTQEIANKAISAQKAEYTELKAPPAGISKTIKNFKTPRKRGKQEVAVEEKK